MYLGIFLKTGSLLSQEFLSSFLREKEVKIYSFVSGNNRRLEGKKVLLLESSAKQEYTPQEQYSNRVVALNQQTRTLLSSLGAWQHIEAVRYCPVRKMQVVLYAFYSFSQSELLNY